MMLIKILFSARMTDEDTAIPHFFQTAEYT